ncbi:uncharacterized protein LOC118232586 [Anguilla anguilla]|uniref:uncharacterized protein LOC118232586 n=1 Tax=Anguilla anguilla TaxID=7936 RepID=UPI0015AE284C|nr:uncharacterized protein LOC118232586 [Anguilla anguilla]
MAAFADCNREKTHWSSYEAQVLLTLWADSSIQQALESTVRNEGVYSRITSELAAVGIHRSIKQCREKIKKLKQQYKKLKDQNRKIDAEWYVTMDSVLGHRPGASFECDVTYYSPDTAVENGIALADEAQLGSDGALFGASPSVENGHRKTEHHATKRWNNQRRRILLKAKQTALRRLAFQGRSCPSVAAATRGERNARREPYSLPPSEDKFSSGIHNQPTETEFYEENTGEKQHIIKTETKESFEGQRSTVQQDLLAAQQEQCRLMAEHNAIQRTLVRAVSRGNRCASELAKSTRAQTAVAAGVQDRIVQLLERQEWTNQLLAMKVMGVSSTAPQNAQEMRAGLSVSAAGPSSVDPSALSGKEVTELSLTSSATDQGTACYLIMDSLRLYDGALPWTPEEIQAMLSIWADSTIQKELESSVRNEKVFLRISSELAAVGFLRSAKQCREKVKKLKQEYRKLKDHNSQGGLDRTRGKCWFNLMDTVLGNTTPSSTMGGSLLSNSAVAILEAMSSPSQTSEDSALTGDEPIVEVQILGEEQPPIIQAMPDERFPSHAPAVSMPKQAVKRKRALCSSEEWKKMIAESDEQYVGALHRMMESESQHRREELRMRREEMELKRADAQLMKDEASSSSAVQGQLVGVLGQIAELFRAKQAALHARAPLGGHAPSPSPSPAASQTAPRGGQAGSELHTPAGSDAQPGADRCQTAAAESHEENRSRRTQNAIKTEVEEPVAVQLGTDTGPINLETAHARYEEGPARGATQGASAIAVQQDLLAAQREQCRLMAEHNAIQRTLVRAVSRGNRCVSELAKSIRAQTAVAAGVQDRIVQLLERQEWTNQLLTMKVMGVSSTAPQNPQETQAGLSLPSAGPSSVFPSLFPEQEAAELSLTSSATHLSNAL